MVLEIKKRSSQRLKKFKPNNSRLSRRRDRQRRINKPELNHTKKKLLRRQSKLQQRQSKRQKRKLEKLI